MRNLVLGMLNDDYHGSHYVKVEYGIIELINVMVKFRSSFEPSVFEFEKFLSIKSLLF